MVSYYVEFIVHNQKHVEVGFQESFLVLIPSPHQPRSNRYPYEHENPHSSFKYVIIMKENTPRHFPYKMKEEKLEGDCHAQPHKTDSPSLA